MSKIAIVLFNLGGPDNLQAVRPFLLNLFNDKAIINIPQPFRFLLANLISLRRKEFAKEIYKNIGGGSPILQETVKQSNAIEKELNKKNKYKFKCFISMRYWHPFLESTIKEIEKWTPDQIILFPLYPQFSTTTTGSSFSNWNYLIEKSYLSNITTNKICCYSENTGFIEAYFKLIKDHLQEQNVRLLFSAHGLPKKIIESGDPYEFQISKSVSKILKKLSIPNSDYVICYQSKVGPLQWLSPSTESEIIRAGKEQKSIVLIPISFVSEHSETLYELDQEYKRLAEDNGVKDYIRIPTVRINKEFIKGISKTVFSVLEEKKDVRRLKKCNCNYKKCWKNLENSNVFVG